MFKFDLDHFDKNLEEFRDTLNIAIDNLSIIANEPSKIFDDENAYDAFMFIGKAVHNYDVDFKTFTSKNIGNFLCNLNSYLYEKRNEIKFDLLKESKLLGSVKKRVERARRVFEKNEKRVNALGNSFFLSMVLLRNSYEIFEEFLKKGGINSFINFISDENFLKTNKNIILNDPTNKPFGLLDYIILNIAHISTKTLNQYKTQWKDLEIVNKLLNIVKIDNSCLLHVYLTLINVITDIQQIENLIDFDTFAKRITQLLLQAKRDFTNDDFNRFTRQIHFNGNILECEIHSVKDEKSISISIKVLLDCLGKILVNDKKKADIYFRLNLKDCFKIFLTKGNLVEINLTLQILSQLIFNDLISLDIHENNKLMECLDIVLKKQVNRHEQELFEHTKRLIGLIKWFQWQTELKTTVFSLE